MRLLFIAGLLGVSFAFSEGNSSRKMKKQSLAEHNMLKTKPSAHEVLEVVEEAQKSESPAEGEGQLSLQLMKTQKDSENRQLAQTPEPAPLEPAKQEEPPKEERVKEVDNLKSLVHESLFEKLRIRRDLDVFNEDQEDLSLEDEEIEVQEDFGNVEVHWKHQKADQK